MSPAQFVDVILVPPIQCPIMGTQKISYISGSAVGFNPATWTPDNPIFSPKSWATSRAKWIGYYDVPAGKITGYRGYTSAGGSSVSVTYGSLTTNGGTMCGIGAYGGTSGVLTVSGGPADPCGSTWTVGKAQLEIAFISTTGTVWYRAIQIYATYPARDARPV
jgi:hypothetical protein